MCELGWGWSSLIEVMNAWKWLALGVEVELTTYHLQPFSHQPAALAFVHCWLALFKPKFKWSLEALYTNEKSGRRQKACNPTPKAYARGPTTPKA